MRDKCERWEHEWVPTLDAQYDECCRCGAVTQAQAGRAMTTPAQEPPPTLVVEPWGDGGRKRLLIQCQHGGAQVILHEGFIEDLGEVLADAHRQEFGCDCASLITKRLPR